MLYSFLADLREMLAVVPYFLHVLAAPEHHSLPESQAFVDLG